MVVFSRLRSNAHSVMRPAIGRRRGHGRLRDACAARSRRPTNLRLESRRSARRARSCRRSPPGTSSSPARAIERHRERLVQPLSLGLRLMFSDRHDPGAHMARHLAARRWSRHRAGRTSGCWCTSPMNTSRPWFPDRHAGHEPHIVEGGLHGLLLVGSAAEPDRGSCR